LPSILARVAKDQRQVGNGGRSARSARTAGR
jgi:hypothetical protein